MKKYLKVKVKTTDKNVLLPKYQTKGASCMDVYANASVTLPPLQATIIPTGLIVELPQDVEMLVRARSGLSTKNILVANGIGTIDEDYRGEVGVILINLNNVPKNIDKGDRIAQVSFAHVIKADWEEVETVSETERGSGGFGSTGGI